MRERGTEAWAKWRVLMAEQKQSGESVAAFCRERGLPASQFFAWKRRLLEAEAAKFVAVEAAPIRETRRPAAEQGSAIEVRLGRCRSLMVEPGFDADHLRALLAALEA